MTDIECTSCGKFESEVSTTFLACYRCTRARYCSTECRQDDWKFHRPYCSKGADGNTGATGEGEARRLIEQWLTPALATSLAEIATFNVALENFSVEDYLKWYTIYEVSIGNDDVPKIDAVMMRPLQGGVKELGWEYTELLPRIERRFSADPPELTVFYSVQFTYAGNKYAINTDAAVPQGGAAAAAQLEQWQKKAFVDQLVEKVNEGQAPRMFDGSKHEVQVEKKDDQE
ncbi:hypothetical protein YB2330_000684 [Saitoella coloradoensis]